MPHQKCTTLPHAPPNAAAPSSSTKAASPVCPSKGLKHTWDHLTMYFFSRNAIYSSHTLVQSAPGRCHPEKARPLRHGRVARRRNARDLGWRDQHAMIGSTLKVLMSLGEMKKKSAHTTR